MIHRNFKYYGNYYHHHHHHRRRRRRRRHRHRHHHQLQPIGTSPIPATNIGK